MIFITGTGRCGTSALAGALSRCGFQFGDQAQLIGPNYSNMKGNWENESVRSLNHAILTEASGCTHDWDFFEVPIESPALDARFGDEIRNLAKNLGPDCIIKDPRFSYTLPLWKRHVAVHHVIYMFRHPVAVSESLCKRDGMPREIGLALWLHLVRAFERHTPFRACTLIEYETFLSAPRNSLEWLHRRLGRDIQNSQLDRGVAWIESGLNHHRNVSRQRLPGITGDVLESLREAARAQQCGQEPHASTTNISRLSEAEPMTAKERCRILGKWISGLTQSYRALRHESRQDGSP